MPKACGAVSLPPLCIADQSETHTTGDSLNTRVAVQLSITVVGHIHCEADSWGVTITSI